jgi:hypothetical protein
MSKNLPDELKPEPVLEVEAAVAARLAQQRPHPCHSDAGFIGEESASCRQRIPRATMPRFEMTILWEFSNYANNGS